MEELGSKVAVVTGAARGIGFGIAAAFAGQGMRVVMSDLPSATLHRAAERLGDRGATVSVMACDVRDPDEVDALAERALEVFGSVNVLCNNAGVMASGLAWELSLEDWHRVLDVNLWGVVHGIRSFVPHLIHAPGGGHVVNVASMAAVLPVASIAPYNVSKHGVLALSETLEKDLEAAGADVGVTVVMPGRVATSLGLRAPGEPEVSMEPKGKNVLAPEAVGDAVIDALVHRRRFLFTHPHLRGTVEERFGAILAD